MHVFVWSCLAFSMVPDRAWSSGCVRGVLAVKYGFQCFWLAFNAFWIALLYIWNGFPMQFKSIFSALWLDFQCIPIEFSIDFEWIQIIVNGIWMDSLLILKGFHCISKGSYIAYQRILNWFSMEFGCIFNVFWWFGWVLMHFQCDLDGFAMEFGRSFHCAWKEFQLIWA